jgi:hypothetical protein
LPFRASSLSQENSPLTYPGAGPPEFRTSFGAGGARVLTESPPTPYSPRSPSFTSRPRAVPLTPPYRPACRPHRAVARATADKIHTQRTVGIFPFRKFLFFLCLIRYGRTSPLGSFYRGAVRVHDNKNKTRLFPVTRPHAYSSQNTISRCQGKSRSGRPVAAFGAPPNLPCACSTAL